MSNQFWHRSFLTSRILFPLTFILLLFAQQGSDMAAMLAATSVASAMLWQYSARRQRRRPNVSYAPMQLDDEHRA
ncbi:hypothetical protein GCM10027277_16250 [Pseudoduganella ginsengisoli]|uniref:Uncharacterized protein n=1 Tax=Pseudoduganella ginsengisoli TaxID=1462440 RepID=A0A6L6PUB3_9BURK|nr:hypothetical protein [Pseudoduganella ginsengisoli]MTW01113.1 hypothetical protein [Pseudoduganella ginsengisoli]